jgi:hypothetical protein
VDKKADGSITLTREELYGLVWATPIDRLAKDYGLSGNGLAKICFRHHVPRPGRGYWAMRAHGYKATQHKLRRVDDAALQTITIRPHPVHAERSTKKEEPMKPVEPTIPVAERLVNPHPLVARAKAAYEGESPDKHGVVGPHYQRQALNVDVAPKNLGRALRIMDALLKALEARGHGVKLGVTGWSQKPVTCAVIWGHEIEFSLREVSRIEKKERPPEVRWLGRYDSVYIPTGQFRLHIDEWAKEGERRSWSDRAGHRIEDVLHEFVARLIEIGEHRKEQRRLEAIEAERAAVEEKARRAKLELVRQEEERRKALEADAEAWHRSQRVRAFIEAVRGAVIAAQGEGVADDVARWSAWANEHADRLDPLTRITKEVPLLGIATAGA